MSFYTAVTKYWERMDRTAKWLVTNCIKLSQDSVEMAQDEYKPRFEVLLFPSDMFEIEKIDLYPRYLVGSGESSSYEQPRDVIARGIDSTGSYSPATGKNTKRSIDSIGHRTTVAVKHEKKEKQQKLRQSESQQILIAQG
jgi:hypothetical protein